MRVLSTVLLAALACAGTAADGQGSPRGDAGVWLSLAGGSLRDFTVSDRASDATWLLVAPRAISGGVEWGRSEQMLGVRVQRLAANMTFAGPSCAYCDGAISALSVLGTFRRASFVPSTRLLQMVQLMAGVTAWHSLRGRNGHEIEPISPLYDLSYGAGIGLGYVVTARLEASATYEILMARHRLEALATNPRAPKTGEIGMAGLRVVARYQLRP